MKHTKIITTFILPVILVSALLLSHYSFSQAPEIEWQTQVGSTANEIANSIEPTPDGGFIIAAQSGSSTSGNKTTPYYGDFDYYLIKLNAAGEIEWQQSYGGSDLDILMEALPLQDGGYILAGMSESPISGNKTVANHGTSSSDNWIIKVNSIGEIEWQKTIGSDNADRDCRISKTDGGYYIACGSDGGASGDKSESSTLGDPWVIKIDLNGNIIWENVIKGGAGEHFGDLTATADGGCIIGSWSMSNIGYDKTENCYGLYDYWIVKLNASGDIVWDKTIGGNKDDHVNSVESTTDGGCIASGFTISPPSGNKTANFFGGDDFWVVKLNAEGEVTWDKAYGGSSYEEYCYVKQTRSGEYIITGWSGSNISGKKTENSMGEEDYWVLKLNQLGGIIWQNTIGGSFDDDPRAITQSIDGGYVVTGYSDSNISGDKTTDIYGAWDIWVVKLMPSECDEILEVCNGVDDNCDGVIDDITIECSISTSDPLTICQGSSVNLVALHTGTSLQWKKDGVDIPGATGSDYYAIETGDYSCEAISDCDSDISNSIHVTVNKLPKAIITADGPTEFCPGGTVVLTANIGLGLTYQWYKGATALVGATSYYHTVTSSGKYKCLVTRTATGCSKFSKGIQVTVSCKNGISEDLITETNTTQFIISPNPNNGTFEISIQNLAAASPFHKGGLRGMIVDVYNPLGQLIYSQKLNSTDGNINETISINNLTSGIYFIRISDGINASMQKLIIQ